ncbi:hypothetical protein ECZU06_00250 [Escherichia coli]|nr:hypothetical protein ECZU06_00250 [Escherichia coli]
MPSTIYIATTAATISQTVLPSADWKARVLPELRGDIHRQIQRLSVSIIACTASPSE